MAICIGRVKSWIESGTPGGGKDADSCYLFPGSGLPHYYAYVSGHVQLVVDEDSKVYIGFYSDFSFSGSSLVGTEFPSFFGFQRDYWEWWPSDTPPSTSQVRFTLTRSSSPGAFDFRPFNTVDIAVGQEVDPGTYGLYHVGYLSDFNWDEETGDGYMYMLGSAYYTVTDPDMAYSKKIIFEGSFPLHDYFPWALWDGTKWKPCNDNEHGFQSHNGTTWVDGKNQDGNVEGSHAFYYNSNQWKVAPRME